MNITCLPLEILQKITSFLNTIYDFECWLMCAYVLEEIKGIQQHRCELTVSKLRDINKRTELLFNTKFSVESRRKRLQGVFDNFLLVSNKEEKDKCLREWINIDEKEKYYSFIKKYKTVWYNKPLTVQRRRQQQNKKNPLKEYMNKEKCKNE